MKNEKLRPGNVPVCMKRPLNIVVVPRIRHAVDTHAGRPPAVCAHTYSFSLATSGVFLFSHSLRFLLTPAFESEGQDHLRETGLPDV